MQIIVQGELIYDLSLRRDRTLFLSYIEELTSNNAYDELLSISQELDALLSNQKVSPKLRCIVDIQDYTILALKSILTKEVKAVFKSKKTRPPETSIGISYRNDEGKRMHGAFFDHYTLRRISKRRTHIISSATTNIEKLHEFNRHSIFRLNLEEHGPRVHLKHNTDSLQAGLIVIPGHTRHLNDQSRHNFEKELIRQARLRGQPILAICAGSWTLWQAYGGKTKPVKGHAYASMPYIISDNSIGNNKQIHSLKLNKDSILSAAMGHPNQPVVNSLHWLAADAIKVPKMLEISAQSKKDDGLVVYSRQAEAMDPEEDSIEAFETKYGAPMIGVQWHPECYYSKPFASSSSLPHIRLINYMAQAGDVYQAKRQVLQDLPHAYMRYQVNIFKTRSAIRSLQIDSVETYLRTKLKNR